MDNKVEENRIRRMADRQGFVLERSKKRDRYAPGFGLYRLRKNGLVVTGDWPSMGEPEHDSTLGQIEAWLETPWAGRLARAASSEEVEALISEGDDTRRKVDRELAIQQVEMALGLCYGDDTVRRLIPAEGEITTKASSELESILCRIEVAKAEAARAGARVSELARTFVHVARGHGLLAVPEEPPEPDGTSSLRLVSG